MAKSRCRDGALLAGFILALLLVVSAEGATLTVTSTADAGGTCPGANCTLRQAILAAASGDTINFAGGLSTVTLTSAELLINKNLTINGPGAGLLTVQRSTAGGTPEFRIFRIEAGFSATLSGFTIANGNGGDFGGGVYTNGGTLTLIEVAISGNRAATQGGSGGGIYIFSALGTCTILRSTISANNAALGGGIYRAAPSGSGAMNIHDSTISGNVAALSTAGGGISNSGSVPLTITNSTISGNMAPLGQGGGIFNQIGGAVNLRNTIIALNTGDTPDLDGTFLSQDYNLIGNTGGSAINGVSPSDQRNVNPMLGPLQDNGGPTFTHALLSGSPAIERGHSSGSNTDQRGLARPVDSPAIPNASGGDGGDIGAYEVQADQLPGCSNINRVVQNNNDSGTDSLRHVIGNVCAGSTITFAPNVTGAINLTSGELLINKTLTINGPGANLLSVQRSVGAANFRIFTISSANVIAAISGLTIANGNSSSLGGGVFNLGTLTLSNSIVSGNSSDFFGGGISGGTVNMRHSTLSGNSAPTAGGIGGSTLNLSNSTISGNTALSGNGGGIVAGNVTLTSSTITGNSASSSGGGIFIDTPSGGTARARNTIIALNTAVSGGPDVSGPLTSENFNLIGNSSGATITPAQFSDQLGTAGSPINPMLGPLQNNGGTTLTCALLAGSTAIDKGHSSGTPADQRGFTRPVGNPMVSDGDGSDIGAFEFGSTMPALRITSISRLLGGEIVLQGFGVPNTTHSIFASPTLNPGDFFFLGNISASATGLWQFDDDTAVGLTMRFYRATLP